MEWLDCNLSLDNVVPSKRRKEWRSYSYSSDVDKDLRFEDKDKDLWSKDEDNYMKSKDKDKNKDFPWGHQHWVTVRNGLLT